jgi:hypothetical protein
MMQYYLKKRCSSTSVDIRLMTGKQNNANYSEEATFFSLIFSLHKSTKKKQKKRVPRTLAEIGKTSITRQYAHI